MATGTVNQKKAEIDAKIDVIKKINDNPSGFINNFYDNKIKDLPSLDGIIQRRIGDFGSKRKAKKTQTTDILGDLIEHTQKFLETDSSYNDIGQKPGKENKLKNYAIRSAKKTVSASKQIIMDSIKNALFSGDGVCGTYSLMPFDSIFISPKEFDFLNMLLIPPLSTVGKIMYEPVQPTGFIKMNTEFFNGFNSPIPYDFISNNNNLIFTSTWDFYTQKYAISGLFNNGSVQDFLTDYYSSIEFPNTETIIKNAMLMLLQGDGSEPQTFTIGLNFLDRLLTKLFSLCGDKKGKDLPLNQNSINQTTDDDDLEWYFDFDDVEGINLDDEDARLRKVLKFADCNNFEVPVNTNHIKDFVYFSNNLNLEQNTTDTLNKVAVESYEQSGGSIPIENLEISISLSYILKIPRAIISAVLSPKLFFPVALIYKMYKSLELSSQQIMKVLSKMFYNIITRLFWYFIHEFWKLVKKELLKFLKIITTKILLNKSKRIQKIIMSLIALLSKLLTTKIGSCEDLFGFILSTIDAAFNQKIGISVPGLLLVLSDGLPGYSTDKAIMNITERLVKSGVHMGDMYGRPNKLNSVIKGIIEGHSDVMDTDSYVEVVAKPGVLPTLPGGGGTVIGPFNRMVGKVR